MDGTGVAPAGCQIAPIKLLVFLAGSSDFLHHAPTVYCQAIRRYVVKDIFIFLLNDQLLVHTAFGLFVQTVI